MKTTITLDVSPSRLGDLARVLASFAAEASSANDPACPAVSIGEMARLILQGLADADAKIRQKLVQYRLTPRQLDIALFIHGYQKAKGMSPTITEIGQGLGGVNKVTVFEHLGVMEAKGAIRRNKHKARSLELVL
jgi:hypothetical protein